VLFVTHQIDEAVFLSRPRAGVRAPSRRLRETVAIDLPRARASRSSARPNSCATSTTSGG
jgi:ABC-type nitrate/sulfonate/bicarbonate transport system ATPase subunit